MLVSPGTFKGMCKLFSSLLYSRVIVLDLKVFSFLSLFLNTSVADKLLESEYIFF